MGFWKSLFSPTEASSVPTQAVSDDYAINATGSEQTARIVFSTDRYVDLYELEELCDAVGWSRRPLRKGKKAIQHSFLVITMWEMRGSRKRLIGFSRATSDHAFNATIWDVVVHPSFQGQGFAQELMAFAETYSKTNSYTSVRLDTYSQNKRNQRFYEQRGNVRLGDIFFPKQSSHPFHCYELVL